MNETKFYYGKVAQNKIAFLFLALGIFGILFAYYEFFIVTDVIWPARRVISIFLIVLGFGAFIYLMMKPKKSGEIALIINNNGIEGKTTAPAKAAGLIEWSDIEDLQIGKGAIRIFLHDKQKYLQRMNSFMAKEGFKGAQQTIFISIMEINATSDEIMTAMQQYQS